jgi:hypothetical protein
MGAGAEVLVGRPAVGVRHRATTDVGSDGRRPTPLRLFVWSGTSVIETRGATVGWRAT